MIVTVEDLKAHSRIEGDTEDELIEAKIAAAQSHVESMLGYEIAVEFPTVVPGGLVEAVRQFAAHFYENREATSPAALLTVPDSAHDLLRPYREWTVG